VGDAALSWNIIDDVRLMWSLPSMVNAFRAGTVVAILAAIVGWYMVVRRQSFAGHTLSVVGFPGAAAAVFLGIGVAYGYFAFCIVAALVIALAGTRAPGRVESDGAVIGTVNAVALATGLLFVALYRGFLNGTTELLFGSVLGITADQVAALAVTALVVLGALAVIGRPLLFASVDSALARSRGVPTRTLDIAFLILLGTTVAEVSQVTGALLVFALLALPPATSQLVTARPVRGIALAIGIALVTVWLALFWTYFSPYPVGFWLTSIAFGFYLLAAGYRKAGPRARREAR
jgi:zinc/manganese transport system permease protein